MIIIILFIIFILLIILSCLRNTELFTTSTTNVNIPVNNRDNYIIIKENYTDLVKLQKFLSTKTALYLFEATRYRMKYLERYAFQLIPDITRLIDFP